MALFGAFFSSDPSLAGITVQVKAEDAADAPVVEEVELYGASYALVIGLDDYRAGWPKLRNGVRDAEQVAAALEALGFEVGVERNPDAERLRSVFKEFFVLKGADPEARLLVWFAGHGQSVKGEGFLVPVDAPPPGDPGFALYALPLRDLGTLVRLARAKHVLAIFDSCFSGTIFEARAGIPPVAITQATLQPVRQFLSSGDADQTVADDGSFRELFLRALEGQDHADANGDGYLTGSELGAYMADRVTNLTGGAQTPRFGKLLDVNYNRGDFVFVLPGGTPAAASAELPAPPAPAADPSLEVAFWTTIKDSANPADFQAYLSQFPQGTFAPLARIRLDALDGSAGEASPPEPAAAEEPVPEPVAEPAEEPAAAATTAALEPGAGSVWRAESGDWTATATLGEGTITLRVASEREGFDAERTFPVKEDGSFKKTNLVDDRASLQVAGRFPRLRFDFTKGGSWSQKDSQFVLEFTQVQ
jgi:hypothetical protein